MLLCFIFPGDKVSTFDKFLVAEISFLSSFSRTKSSVILLCDSSFLLSDGSSLLSHSSQRYLRKEKKEMKKW